MSSLAAIEIRQLPGGVAPVELIETAYRASKRGRIILLLDGIAPDAVDAALEPLVPTMRLTIPGLQYVDADDSASVLTAMGQACTIFVSGSGKLSRLAQPRDRVHDLADVSSMLARLCRPTRLAEMNG